MSAEPAKDAPISDLQAVEVTKPTAEVTEPPVTEPPVTETSAAEAKTEAVEPTSAAISELPKEEKVGEDAVKVEAQPITSGHLGYKAPGLLKSLRFSSKYFWFGDEALEESTISSYLRNEKVEHKNHNAAHASQTGKGLFLFAKREEDKPAPQGILNLSDAADVVKEGILDLSVKIHGQKHTFQAPSKRERDGWLVALEKAVQEAKSSREGVVGSEGYKSNLSKYNKPAAVGAGAGAGAAVATKAATSKPDDKVHDGTTEGAATTATAVSEPVKKEEKREEKKDEKSRSQSRKRGSIFGKVLGKKDEPEEKKVEKEHAKEEKKIEKEQVKEEKKAEKEEAKEEKQADKAEAAAAAAAEKEAEKEQKREEKEEKKQEKVEHKKEEEAAAIAAGTAAGATVASEETKPKEESKPKEQEKAPASALKSKRGSVFGSMPFFGKKKEETPKKDDEVPPAVPAKDPQPVSDTAPQLDNPVKPEETTETTAPVTEPKPVTTDATAKDTTAKDVTEAAAPAAVAAAASPSTKNKENERSESKGGFLSFLKPKESQHDAKKEEKKEVKAEDKAEKEIKAEERAEKKAEKENVKPAETTPAPTVEKAVATPAKDTTSTPKERRRSSFFGTLGKKEKKPSDTTPKKSDSAVSDAEATDNEKKSNKLQGLFRKASKSVKGTNGVTDAEAPPVPAKEGEVAKEGEAVKTGEASQPAMESEVAKPAPATEVTETGHVPSNDAAAGAVSDSTAVPTSTENTETSAPAVTASA